MDSLRRVVHKSATSDDKNLFAKTTYKLAWKHLPNDWCHVQQRKDGTIMKTTTKSDMKEYVDKFDKTSTGRELQLDDSEWTTLVYNSIISILIFFMKKAPPVFSDETDRTSKVLRETKDAVKECVNISLNDYDLDPSSTPFEVYSSLERKINTRLGKGMERVFSILPIFWCIEFHLGLVKLKGADVIEYTSADAAFKCHEIKLHKNTVCGTNARIQAERLRRYHGQYSFLFGKNKTEDTFCRKLWSKQGVNYDKLIPFWREEKKQYIQNIIDLFINQVSVNDPSSSWAVWSQKHSANKIHRDRIEYLERLLKENNIEFSNKFY